MCFFQDSLIKHEIGFIFIDMYSHVLNIVFILKFIGSKRQKERRMKFTANQENKEPNSEQSEHSAKSPLSTKCRNM